MQLREWSLGFPVGYSLRMLDAALIATAAAAQVAAVIIGLSIAKRQSAGGRERAASSMSS